MGNTSTSSMKSTTIISTNKENNESIIASKSPVNSRETYDTKTCSLTQVAQHMQEEYLLTGTQTKVPLVIIKHEPLTVPLVISKHDPLTQILSSPSPTSPKSSKEGNIKIECSTNRCIVSAKKGRAKVGGCGPEINRTCPYCGSIFFNTGLACDIECGICHNF